MKHTYRALNKLSARHKKVCLTITYTLTAAYKITYLHADIDIESVREKDRILIRIKDRGKGMDRETLENIFIPFYTKKATGTGLGMSISKNIIEGHGGKIYIHSKQGLGTEVKIELPSVQKKS